MSLGCANVTLHPEWQLSLVYVIVAWRRTPLHSKHQSLVHTFTGSASLVGAPVTMLRFPIPRLRAGTAM